MTNFDGSVCAWSRFWHPAVAVRLMAFGVLVGASSGAAYAQDTTEEKTAGASAMAEIIATSGVLTVDTLKITGRDEYEVSETFAGRIVAHKSSVLGFQRPGLLVSVNVKEGDRLKKGDILASLDVRTLENQKKQQDARLVAANALIAELRAAKQIAELTLNRQKKLAAQNNVSKQRFDEAGARVKAVNAQITGARANTVQIRVGMDALDIEIELSHIIAPYDGVIVARHVDEGTVVNPGQPILHIIDDRTLELHVGIPSKKIDDLKEGKIYPVLVRGKTVTARLDTVVSLIETDTRTATAILTLDRPEEFGINIRNGELARLSLKTKISADGFWVPIAALAEGRKGLWSGYVFKPEAGNSSRGILERRDLQIIHVENDRVFVRGTVNIGEQLVAAGVHRLAPGQIVKVKR